MAYHKLTLIGKIVGEVRRNEFAGGAVCKFGLPVNFTRPKKNPETGQWEGDSFIINVSVFNRPNYNLADICAQTLRKGSQVYVEGRLKNNEYTDKNGVKVARPELTADVVEFLDPRDGMGPQDTASTNEPMARPAPRPAAPPRAAAPARPAVYEDEHEMSAPSSRGGGGAPDENDIPF